MKKIRINYIAILGFVLSLFACQKNEIDVAPARIAPVSNLQYNVTGDSVLLTWNLPRGMTHSGQL